VRRSRYRGPLRSTACMSETSRSPRRLTCLSTRAPLLLELFEGPAFVVRVLPPLPQFLRGVGLGPRRWSHEQAVRVDVLPLPASAQQLASEVRVRPLVLGVTHQLDLVAHLLPPLERLAHDRAHAQYPCAYSSARWISSDGFIPNAWAVRTSSGSGKYRSPLRYR